MSGFTSIPEFGECKIEYDQYFETIPSTIDTREEVDKILRNDSINDVLSSLSQREQIIIELRYKQELSYKKIGAELHLSSERIRQIHNNAIKKIKRHKNIDLLEKHIYFKGVDNERT